MNNKRKNMSIYITVLLWILIPLLIINGLIFLTSDMLSVFVGGMLSLKLLCYSLFFSYSFLLGYKAQTGGWHYYSCTFADFRAFFMAIIY